MTRLKSRLKLSTRSLQQGQAKSPSGQKLELHGNGTLPSRAKVPHLPVEIGEATTRRTGTDRCSTSALHQSLNSSKTTLWQRVSGLNDQQTVWKSGCSKPSSRTNLHSQKHTAYEHDRLQQNMLSFPELRRQQTRRQPAIINAQGITRELVFRNTLSAIMKTPQQGCHLARDQRHHGKTTMMPCITNFPPVLCQPCCHERIVCSSLEPRHLMGMRLSEERPDELTAYTMGRITNCGRKRHAEHVASPWCPKGPKKKLHIPMTRQRVSPVRGRQYL